MWIKSFWRVLVIVICVCTVSGILYWIEGKGCDLCQHWCHSDKDLHNAAGCQISASSEESSSLENANSGYLPTATPIGTYGSSSIGESLVSSRMEEQIRLSASVFGINFQKDLTGDTIEYLPPFLGHVRKFTLKDGRILRFDRATGQLVMLRGTELENVPPDLTRDDAIGEDQALATIKNLLDAFHINVQVEKVKFECSSQVGVGDDRKEMLRGAEWVFREKLKYKGIPYFGAGIQVAISAYSGKVYRYSYLPIGPLPSSLNEKIDAKKAAQIVKRSLRFVSWLAFPGYEVGAPEKWIARSNNWSWSRVPGDEIVQGNVAYLCWIVPLDNGYDAPLRFFVDAQTGDIRGGF